MTCSLELSAKALATMGRALFPLMPYVNFREFSDEDLASIVVCVSALYRRYIMSCLTPKLSFR